VYIYFNENAGGETPLGPELRVSIQLFGSIKAAACKDGGEVEIPSGCTVYELLRFLSDRYGGAFQEEVFALSDEALRDDCTVSVNGVIMDHANAKTTTVKNGSVIALLPAFPGGG